MKKLIPMMLAFLLLCGCGASNQKEQKRTITAMDTVMTFTVFGTESDVDECCREVSRLESLFSVTDEQSEIACINREKEADLSEETADLLQRGMELCEETDGALDLSIYPVVRAWGFTTGDYRVPDEAELNQLLNTCDYRKIRLDGTHVSIPSDMEIDLGSIAKGYTGDVLVQKLRESGISSALLNLGGNVQALGVKPDGSMWAVGIQNPEGDGVLGILKIDNQAVVTSGGYERFFTDEDGTVFWHIIDPSTGYPADSGLVSVTVVGDSGLKCDALSTALFVKGESGALEYWRNHPEVDLILVTEEGKVLVTEGIAELFEPSDDVEMEIVVMES